MTKGEFNSLRQKERADLLLAKGKFITSAINYGFRTDLWSIENLYVEAVYFPINKVCGVEIVEYHEMWKYADKIKLEL